jgi:hypothetical protein
MFVFQCYIQLVLSIHATHTPKDCQELLIGIQQLDNRPTTVIGKRRDYASLEDRSIREAHQAANHRGELSTICKNSTFPGTLQSHDQYATE